MQLLTRKKAAADRRVSGGGNTMITICGLSRTLFLLTFALIIVVETTNAQEEQEVEENAVVAQRRMGGKMTKLILKYHNMLRQYVSFGYYKEGKTDYGYPTSMNMHKIFWDDSLATGAQAKAESCSSSNEVDQTFGENIALVKFGSTKKDNDRARVLSAMRKWKKEITLKDKANIDVTMKKQYLIDMPHIIQMIWGKTTKIGCGMGKCDAQQSYVVICRYSEKGNTLGEPIYEVGYPCDACRPINETADCSCDAKDTHLCLSDEFAGMETGLEGGNETSTMGPAENVTNTLISGGNETEIMTNETVINMTNETAIMTNETAINETSIIDGGLFNVTENPLNETGILNGTDIINGTDSIINGTDSIINGTDSIINGTDSIINGTDSIINGTDSIINGTDIIINGTESIINGTDSIINGTDINNSNMTDLNETSLLINNGTDIVSLIEGSENGTSELLSNLTMLNNENSTIFLNGTGADAGNVTDLLIAENGNDTFGLNLTDILFENNATDIQQLLLNDTMQFGDKNGTLFGNGTADNNINGTDLTIMNENGTSIFLNETTEMISNDTTVNTNATMLVGLLNATTLIGNATNDELLSNATSLLMNGTSEAVNEFFNTTVGNFSMSTSDNNGTEISSLLMNNGSTVNGNETADSLSMSNETIATNLDVLSSNQTIEDLMSIVGNGTDTFLNNNNNNNNDTTLLGPSLVEGNGTDTALKFSNGLNATEIVSFNSTSTGNDTATMQLADGQDDGNADGDIQAFRRLDLRK